VDEREKTSDTTIDNLCRTGLLTIVLLMPIATLLPLGTYRAIEALTYILCVVALVTKGRYEFSPLIRWSFWLGLLGWLLATVNAENKILSFDVGALDFLGIYALLYLSSTYLNDRKHLFLAIRLFLASFMVQSFYQAWFVLTPLWADGRVNHYIPILAVDLIHYKNAVPFFFPNGIPNTYGNIANYASLWTLVITLSIGLLYTRLLPKLIVWPLIILAMWCGLIVYSRSALLSVMLAIVAIWIFRLITVKTVSAALLVIAAVLASIHLQPKHLDRSVAQYYENGIVSFIKKVDAKSDTLDVSGDLRAEALSRGLKISAASFPIGVGYGRYTDLDPEITSPHNMAIHRLAESGVLGFLSILLLAAYAPFKLLDALRHRTSDLFTVVCLIAASTFMFKAIVFGATFAISSNMVWALGFALCLTSSTTSAQFSGLKK
jgi:hypothetical protein